MSINIIDTLDIEGDVFGDAAEGYLVDIIEQAQAAYEKRYHTSVVGYLQLSEQSSRYGAIGGAGKTGYRWLDSLDKLFDVSCDYLTASIEDDGLNIVYIDHDGVNTTTMKFVTEAMVESYYTAGKWYDLDEFAEERLVPTTKPTQAYWFKKFA